MTEACRKGFRGDVFAGDDAWPGTLGLARDVAASLRGCGTVGGLRSLCGDDRLKGPGDDGFGWRTVFLEEGTIGDATFFGIGKTS
jgi:hypothetical protein